MKRKWIIGGATALVLAAALLYLYGGHQTPGGEPPLKPLTSRNLTDLKSAFNESKDQPRVLVLLSPT